MTYPIAGLHYRSQQVQELFRQKSSGTVILLQKERNNRNDPHAVAVYAALTLPGYSHWEWVQVGYLARSVAGGEFADLPHDVILEAKKYGSGSIQLTGKTRRYM